MLPYLSKMLLFVVSLLALLASPSWAQTFEVNLGGRTLGTLTYTRDGKVETMQSTLNKTPLGVFNGNYEGKSQPVKSGSGKKVHQYLGVKKSTRKSRKSSVLFDQGTAIETTIDPVKDRTDLSEVAAVPNQVVDPVAAFGRLVAASHCPEPFQFYDGRRVITLAPDGSSQNGGVLNCDMSYEVTHGPGHLSPLYIRSISVSLTYETVDGQTNLTTVRFSSGPFKVKMTRQD